MIIELEFVLYCYSISEYIFFLNIVFPTVPISKVFSFSYLRFPYLSFLVIHNLTLNNFYFFPLTDLFPV